MVAQDVINTQSLIKLKNCGWERSGDGLIIASNRGVTIDLADPDGQVDALLAVLRTGVRDAAAVAEALTEAGHAVTIQEVVGALNSLDDLRLLEHADRSIAGRSRNQRDFSNLAYFDLFSGLDVAAADLQQRVRDAHVVQLGTGGLGSNVLQSLCGLGVGRLTLLDNDLVEPANLARQFLYREDQIGTAKVQRAADWVRAFNSDIDVRAIDRWVSGPEDVADLLDDADLVVSGIDQPSGIDDVVNEACVRAGVPWVRGGMSGAFLIYFSVDPGRSPCYRCYTDGLADDARRRTSDRLERVNRGCGPAAALVGSLVAFEALRYLTGYAQPHAAGSTVMIDTADGCTQSRVDWTQQPDCPICVLATQSSVPVP